MDGGATVWHQPCSKPDFHANSVRFEKPATGGFGHCDRLGNDHLDDGVDLEALQMGRCGSSALFRLGVDCERSATVDYVLELGQMILRLSQKLSTKIKTGKLTEMSLDENPYADWSCHLFMAGRTQYILTSNIVSL